MLIGGIGQSLTSAVLGLLISILTLSVVAAADQNTQFWTGICVFLYATVFVYRMIRPAKDDWDLAGELVDMAASTEKTTASTRKTARQKFGPFENTPAQVMRQTAFSPTFTMSPLFVAAAGSGLTNVWNALPVIVLYLVGSIVGQVILTQFIEKGRSDGLVELTATRFDHMAAIGVAVLGIVTAVTA